jgi:hypothetical protein
MKEGGFLELLVECLLKLLASDGIKVSRNEKFYNSKGTQIGEVDVVIEGVYDSKYIKIGTECRDRKGKQDRNWIRQIIGKRVDLAEFGFTHWVAVSKYGFKSTAEELAKKAGIALLVPGKVKPVEPEKNGPHSWGRFDMTKQEWTVGPFQATVLYDNDEISEEMMDEIEKKIQSETYIILHDKKTLHVTDFLTPQIENLSQKFDKSNDKTNSNKSHFLKFHNLDALVAGVNLKFSEFKMEVFLSKVILSNNFSMLAFAIPDTKKILGLICINEYQYKGETLAYLMVGVNPGDASNPIMLYRDKGGNPVPNQKMTFLIPQYPTNTPLKKITFRGK